MDMNTEKIRALSDQVEKLQLQINALAKAFKVCLDYKPHDYEVNNLPEEEEM